MTTARWSSRLRSTEPAARPRCRGLRLLCAAALLAATAAAAQTVTSTVPLSFGAFTAGSGGNLSITPGGLRSRTGGVMTVNQGSTATAAQFAINGTPSAAFNITLPADGTVVLSAGAQTMALNGFVSSPAATGVLSGGGTQNLAIGATLVVGNQQEPGSYAGAFTVTVNYE